MDLNGAVNPQNQPDPRQAGHNFRGAILHHCIFLPVMAILGWLVQLKYTSATASPFVTDYVTIRMFIVAFLVYFGFLTVEILLAHAPNSDLGEFINNIIFLFGTLASFLLLLILVRDFGLFALILWTIYLVRDVATKKSYRNAVCDVFNKVKEMINGHLVEINGVQFQPPPHIVVQIQDAGEPNVL
ncbi:uncharacterized protein LOC133740782 [Rosa rugosa]|uniref:uncharacterized protein LOC133740782 n=1 Tax=Rosa rugosa TaxID=74645 RepID=UPI002B40C41E|nr:uncharacterized protein LOC133740782 [Rosa rugosa]